MVQAFTLKEANNLHSFIADNPIWFFETVLGCKPYIKQKEILEAIKIHRRVAVVGCNGSGKDWTAGRIILWWLSSRYPAKAVIIGPTHRQVVDIVWKEARLAHATAPSTLGGKMMETPRWKFSDEHFAIGLSTNDPYNLQGFHSPNLLVIITEAHAVEQADVDAIKRLNPQRILMTGNPFTMTGEFYEAFHSQADMWHNIKISAYDTPNIIEGKIVIPGLLTLQDIAEREWEWGKDSIRFKGSILGEFPETLEDTLIQRAWVDGAIARTCEAGQPKLVACDVARFGSDKTVAIRRDGPKNQLIFRVQGQDTMQIAGWLKGYMADHPELKFVVVDDTGLGGGVTDRLREQKVRVVPFIAGARAADDTRYVNAIAEAWSSLAQELRNGTIQIPRDSALISQLSARRYKIQSDRRIILESKEDLKTRGGHSPDEADALAMAYSPKAMPQVKLWV